MTREEVHAAAECTAVEVKERDPGEFETCTGTFNPPGITAVEVAYENNRVTSIWVDFSKAMSPEGQCLAFEAHQVAVDEMLGAKGCEAEDQRMCVWNSAEGVRFSTWSGRKDASVRQCSLSLKVEDGLGADRRVKAMIDNAIEAVGCGQRKTAEEFRELAKELRENLLKKKAELMSYAPRLDGFTKSLRDGSAGKDVFADFPALSFEDRFEFTAAGANFAVETGHYTRLIADRIKRVELASNCLAKLEKGERADPRQCSAALCPGELGWRADRCVYGHSLTDKDGFSTSVHFLFAPPKALNDDVYGCAISAHFFGGERKPSEISYNSVAYAYFFDRSSPASLTEFAKACGTPGGTEPTASLLRGALKDFPFDRWLRAWKASSDARRKKCSKVAQDSCENVYKIRDIWAMQYQTVGCTIRKAAKTDIERDVEKGRGYRTDAELAEHAQLIEVLEACAAFKEAGVTWSFREPVLTGSCAPRRAVPSRAPPKMTKDAVPL